jgi:hypothetical protein
LKMADVAKDEIPSGNGEVRWNRPEWPVAWVVLVPGIIALAGILGGLKALPDEIAFTAGALSIILFPGMALHRLIARPGREWSLPELVTVWSVGGLASLSVISFAGILLRLRLSSVLWIAGLFYLALIVAVLVDAVRKRRVEIRDGRGRSLRPELWVLVLIGLSVALAFTTLYTARDNDDWFYLSYITDYLADQPINSQDAMLGPGWPAPARAWYGSWWVTEAMLSKATGVPPIRCHQTCLRLLLLPLAVLALFTFARSIFKTDRAAYLACFLHLVFYLSSAYPTDSAGWGLLSRVAQDKSLAFFVPTMAAVALGLRVLSRSGREHTGGRSYGYFVYILAVVAASLIHPLGLVWCAIGLVPIAFVELLRMRDRVAITHLVLLLVPLIVFGAILSGAREEAAGVLEERGSGSRMQKEEKPLLDIYLPGDRLGFSSGDRTYEVADGRVIAHPLLVTRFPMALLGLVLTFVLARRVRTDFAARFLVVLTGSVGVLAFVPGVAGVTAGFINERMLYRLTWLFPWGLVIALFLLQLRLKLRWCWLIAIVLALVLARGVPQNYFRTLLGGRLQGRVGPELEEVFGVLDEEASPKGLVLASQNPSLMLPAVVDGAYPVYVSPAYTTGGKGERIRSIKDLVMLLSNGTLDEVLPVLTDLGCRYILIERSRPLANALRRPDARFRKLFENKTYALYELKGSGLE